MSDYNGRTFEFVSKTEFKPIKDEIENIIHKLQNSMRDYKVTCSYKLVGSGGKHLVTRAINCNEGYDFDYNLDIQKSGGLTDRELRQTIKAKLNEVLTEYNYSNVSEGKNSLTIKVIDYDQSSIEHSCDFAIVNDYVDKNDDLYEEILVWIREDDSYIWNKRPYGKNYKTKLANLKANGLWEEVKEEYLNLKNNNMDSNKKSFSIYFEAINNVYNRYEWN
jgi:hypothetical protein